MKQPGQSYRRHEEKNQSKGMTGEQKTHMKLIMKEYVYGRSLNTQRIQKEK